MMLHTKMANVRIGVILVALAFTLHTSEAHTQETANQTPGMVQVAAVQICGYDKGDMPREGYNPIEAIVPYIDKAGKDGAQLVVFPEYVLGRIHVPGAEVKKIAEAAAANHIYVIVGCWEVYDDGTFANTALVFDRKGGIAGKYHKTHAAVDSYEGDPPWSRPPSGRDTEWFIRNDPEWVMVKGDDLPVFDLDFAKVGVLTCYDGWFPESFRVLSLKGAEILVWINGRGGTVEDFIVKSVTFQSHVAMICTNQAYGGGTLIADWPTQIVARCPDRREAYITATINLEAVRKARSFSRNFQQRRPDLYDELVNARAAVPLLSSHRTTTATSEPRLSRSRAVRCVPHASRTSPTTCGASIIHASPCRKATRQTIPTNIRQNRGPGSKNRPGPGSSF